MHRLDIKGKRKNGHLGNVKALTRVATVPLLNELFLFVIVMVLMKKLAKIAPSLQLSERKAVAELGRHQEMRRSITEIPQARKPSSRCLPSRLLWLAALQGVPTGQNVAHR